MGLYVTRVRRAASQLRARGVRGEFALVLGSGLDGIVDAMEIAQCIPYAEIDGFPLSTAPGHKGEMVVGSIEGVPIIGLRGRKHAYEVLDRPNGMREVVFPVHVMAELGVPRYFATNAAGALDQLYRGGDLMIIRSHLNMIPDPLIGPHFPFRTIDGLPTKRFTNLMDAYDKDLRSMLKRAMRDAGVEPREGVYVAVTGPSFETPPEVLFYRDQGDAIGMSTTPEVIVARNRGMRVMGFSLITNTTWGDGTNPAEEDDVLAVLNDPAVKANVVGSVRNFFRIWREETGYAPH